MKYQEGSWSALGGHTAGWALITSGELPVEIPGSDSPDPGEAPLLSPLFPSSTVGVRPGSLPLALPFVPVPSLPPFPVCRPPGFRAWIPAPVPGSCALPAAPCCQAPESNVTSPPGHLPTAAQSSPDYVCGIHSLSQTPSSCPHSAPAHWHPRTFVPGALLRPFSLNSAFSPLIVPQYFTLMSPPFKGDSDLFLPLL